LISNGHATHNDPGIVPDMRYLSPAYLPMLIIGVYALKYAGLDADDGRET